MYELAQRVRGLTGFKAGLLVFFSGVLATFALPPLYVLPVLAIVFPIVIWRLDGVGSVWRAAISGWIFGFGYFLAMVYWVGNAALVGFDSNWPVGAMLMSVAQAVMSVVGLAFLLAFIPALVFALAKVLWRPGPGRILIFAGLWGLGELLREFYLSGFPWAPIGIVWSPFDGVIQFVALFGASGLSVLTVVIFSLFALFGDSLRRLSKAMGLALALVLIASLEIGGQVRVYMKGGFGEWDSQGRWQQSTGAPVESYADGFPLRVRIVQPAVPQSQKWTLDSLLENVRLHLTLSTQPGLEDIKAVIWAETAYPYAMTDEGDSPLELTEILPANGVLITGAIRRSFEPRMIESRRWNSLFVIGQGGKPLAYYDKAHLVPFGEYVPFSGTIAAVLDSFGLDARSLRLPEFSAGEGLKPISVGALPAFSPLICYEVLFPSQVMPSDRQRPKWMVNITNDGWYGRSSGPYQHFQIARLRSIEEGVSLARVASTGISGVISPLGLVSPTIGLDQSGFLDVDVPPPLLSKPPFASFGNALPFILAVGCVLGGLTTGTGRLKRTGIRGSDGNGIPTAKSVT